MKRNTVQHLESSNHHMCKCILERNSEWDMYLEDDMLLLFIRVYNYEPLTPLRTLRANLYGKYVAIRGTVVRVSNIRPICTKLAFTCNNCGDTQSLHLPDGKFTTPTKVPFRKIFC